MARILLVEDNEMNRDMLSRRLVKRGFDVTFALDGREGVDKALSGGFDLILMDISLPEMDGWQLLRMIRSRCVSTVRTPTPSWQAISLLLNPSAMWVSTSFSRLVSGPSLITP